MQYKTFKIRVLIVMCLFFLLFHQLGAQEKKMSQIVPEPVDITPGNGTFILDKSVVVVFDTSDSLLHNSARLFLNTVERSTGLRLQVQKKRVKQKSILLILNSTVNPVFGNEGYVLEISLNTVKIEANYPAGIFYGLQSLLQLFPAQIESKELVKNTEWNIPCVKISDYPRFSWRGLMLDVSRHFFSKEEIKQFIDQMVKYKYNIFHWHLTDDNGWRIEIKAYPRLTKIGAWSIARIGKYGTYKPRKDGEEATYGGFYTQDDIREIIKYAQDRFVTIVPEVDVPAHSKALIAAYPSVSCSGKQMYVCAGTVEPIGENVVCVGNEHNFEMLDTIFGEIASLFPGEYIHIGGDEANRDFWRDCQKCRKQMDEENIQSLDKLQSYFSERISKIITSKGKKIIGWDEILEGGIPSDATVMSWRGPESAVVAAKAGHKAVMSPTQFCYFDYRQADQEVEQVEGNYLPVSKVYQFEPVPSGVAEQFILGGQGNIWTEMIPNFRRVEYMTWPRALAMSEVLWSSAQKRNWNSFVPRMEAQFERFQNAQVNYAPSIYDPRVRSVTDRQGNKQVVFVSEVEGLDIYYTFDWTFPDNFSNKYDGYPIPIPNGASEIWVISYQNGNPMGRFFRFPLNKIKKL